MQNVLPKLIETVFRTYWAMCGKPFEDMEIEVPFGEYANPSFESQVETVSKARQGGVMSIRTSVDELYGDSKDDDWKEEEVRRIKEETGIATLDEASEIDDIDIGGFDG